MKVVAFVGEGGIFAVRLAVQLGECTAVAIAADANACLPALQQARAEGATELICLSDGALAEMERDAVSKELMQAAVLSAFGRRLDARFFVVPDTALGWLGPSLAEELDLPHLTAVLGAELASDGEPAEAARSSPLPNLRIRRRSLHGVQKLRGPVVGVLCVLPEPGSEPALTPPPSKSNLEIQRWDLARLGLGPVDLPRPLLRPMLPERRSELSVRMLDSVAALAQRLRQDGLAPVDGGG